MFRRFPLANHFLLEKWLKALNLQDFTPKSHSRICSSHFVPEDYFNSDTPGKRILLKPHAIPFSFVTKMSQENRLEVNILNNYVFICFLPITHYINELDLHDILI